MGHSVVHYSGEGLKGAFIFGGKNFSAVSDELWFVQDGSSQWKLVTSRNSLRPSARFEIILTTSLQAHFDWS